MKIRQAIKKAVALGTGAMMLGATILGASAANLSDYPTMFLKDGQVSAKIVIGEKAQTIDVVGAIDIAADLQANAVSETSVDVTGTGISVTGGKTKEITIGATPLASGGMVDQFGTLDDNDISSLKDEKISWNDKDIDVDETVTLGTTSNGLMVMSSETDNDFGANIFLGTNTATGAIEYKYTIKDTDLNTSLIGEEGVGSALGYLNVEILGKSFEIKSVDDADTITLNVANEYYLGIGDSVTVDGKTVTLRNVGSSSTETIVVDVDGTTSTVSGTTSSKTVNGIKIQISSAFYVDEVDQRSATLKIGDKITDTISNNDHMTLFGEPDSNDAEWDWIVTKVNDGELVIGAKHSLQLNSDSKDVRAIGEKLNLPNDYLSIYIDSLTAEADKTITVEFSDATVELDTDGTTEYSSIDGKPALVFTAEDEIFRVVDAVGAQDTTEVYLISNASAAGNMFGAFLNSDGDVQLFDKTAGNGGKFQVVYDNKVMNITYTNVSQAGTANSYNVNITGWTTLDETGGWVALQAELDASAGSKFGDSENEAEGGDLTSSISALSGTYDEDYRTTFGLVLKDLKDGFGSDEFVFMIPSEQVQANVVIAGSDAVVASGSGAVTTEKVNPVGVDFAVLDKDFTAGTANSIVVGGPCINTVAAKLLGNPADCTEGFAEGEAKLALFADGSKTALLVAGYTGEDTLGAVRALLTEDLPAKSDAKVITTNYKNPSVE